MSFILMGAQGSAGRQPGTPTIGTVSSSESGTASVPFTAPLYLGKPIGTSYIATSNPGGITGTSSTSPVTVTGLTNGTGYTFTVKLNNGVVDSLSSASSNSVTPAAPPFFPPFFPFFPPACNEGDICNTVQISENTYAVYTYDGNCNCVFAYTITP